MSNKKFLR